uniref:Bardet-Biedl syndrome 7 protein homolog n=2 Tax=Cacopsylla melanoneura TaxID=428564 RepID=A0A8D9AJZ2_9HEMI
MPCKTITCITLGGSLDTLQDKIFVASKSEVRGFTKKGKMFLNFDTCTTDPIRFMHVSGSDLLVAGDHVLTHFHDCKDGSSYVCPDLITGIITLNAQKLMTLVPIVACQDKTLKVLRKSEVTQIIPLGGTPTCVHLFNNDGGVTGDLLLVGTMHGEVVLYQISHQEFSIKWSLPSTKSMSCVTCLYCYDMSTNDSLDLIIGRDDGTIEIYALLMRDEGQMAPMLRFSYFCNESITSLQAGVIGTPGFDEILVTTYSGWLFGLTTESIDKQTNELNANISPATDDKIRISKLKMEIETLEQAVAKERDQYEKLTQEDSAGLCTLPALKVNDKLIIDTEEKAYLLSIEVDVPIDNVLVQCDTYIELLDVDKNTAVLSLSECDPHSGNAVLATYRCQANTTRLEFKFRCDEGSCGQLQVFITPHTQPKGCQLVKYDLRSLCCHVRTHRELEEGKSYNVVNIRGDFSVYEIHSWVEKCLLSIPDKPPATDLVTYRFESILLSTILQVQYSKGFISLTSDNVSSVSILQDFITKNATKKKTKFDIQQNFHPDTVLSTLALIHPQIQEHIDLEAKHSLLIALLDIQTLDAGCDALIPEYEEILRDEKIIKQKFNKQNNLFKYLSKAVVNLFLDWYKHKGINVKSKLSHLELVLNSNYSLDNIIQIFDI